MMQTASWAKISEFSANVLAFSLALGSFSGCTPTKSVRTEIKASGVGGSDEAAGQSTGGGVPTVESTEVTIEICKEVEKVCAKTGPRTFCQLTEFSGHVINQGHQVHALAAGECEAKRLVLAEACARSWDIKTLDSIKCEPDGAAGKCPTAEPMCTAEFNPQVCVAEMHAGQNMDAERPLIAWGANPCNANFSLRRSACARNMNPENLAQINCKSMAVYRGDCPPTPAICATATDSNHECSVQLTPEEGSRIDLVSAGGSECEARYEIASKICAAGFSPSEAESAVNCKKL